MTNLPNLSIINNELFEVYSYKQYPQAFIERLNNAFVVQRKKILDFFNLYEYPKVRINLFDDIKKLNEFSSKYIPISPYHKGDCCGDMINYVCDDEALKDNSKSGYIIASLAHEFVHMVYHDTIQGNKCVWLEEGLATYLSEQKGFVERDPERYKKFLKRIIKEKEIPMLEYLNKRGGKYGEFVDTETNAYDGYDFSYALVRYLNERKGKNYIHTIIKDKAKLLEDEKNIISDFVNYAKLILDENYNC